MSYVYRPPVFQAPIDLDLSKNEGRPSIRQIDLGPEALAAAMSRYPDVRGLAQAVADRHRVAVDRVLVTAGGDDAILRCFLAVAGRAVVATTPSFEMIRRYAAQVESPLIEVPWWDGDFPLAGFLSETSGTPGMAVLVSPNNPTGSTLSPAELGKVADAYPLVVLDAAYAEFADEDLTPAALEMGNVVVIRTLSKTFGLAGLRVGYLLGPDDIVGRLAGFGSPYPVSGLSATLAAEALTAGIEEAEEFARETTEWRQRLFGLLEELRCAPIPSQANFVLATAVSPDWVVPAAAAMGVGLRRFGRRPELSSCVRITVPSDESSWQRLESTLRSVLEPEAVLFDMDGVLVDVRESFRAAVVATASRFGVTVKSTDIAEAKARGNASDDWELTRALCASGGVELAIDDVRDEFEAIYHGERGVEGLKLRERILVAVSRLESWSRRLPLGIVTARPRKDAIELLDRFDIGRFFSTVVSREDAPSKPNPAPVRLAMDQLGVTRAWMVGDTIDDLMAAKEAGVVPIAVCASGEDPAAVAGAARVLESANEIQEVLDATRI